MGTISLEVYDGRGNFIRLKTLLSLPWHELLRLNHVVQWGVSHEATQCGLLDLAEGKVLTAIPMCVTSSCLDRTGHHYIKQAVVTAIVLRIVDL